VSRYKLCLFYFPLGSHPGLYSFGLSALMDAGDDVPPNHTATKIVALLFSAPAWRGYRVKHGLSKRGGLNDSGLRTKTFEYYLADYYFRNLWINNFFFLSFYVDNPKNLLKEYCLYIILLIKQRD